MRSVPLILALGLLLPALAQGQSGVSDPGDLRLAVIVSRHGVRSPTMDSAHSAAEFSASPWPKWDVPLAFLTPHGRRQMVLMGEYYRERYAQEGLLAGRPDAGQVYILADGDERTVESARALGEGLIPGGHPAVHAQPQGHPDPLFRPQTFAATPVDREMAKAEALGVAGGDLAVFGRAYRPEFDLLERVLFGGDGTPPPGKRSLQSIPVSFRRGSKDEVLTIIDPVHLAASLVDNLTLEYAEGMPMSQVGWGRLDPATFPQLLRLHGLYFALTQRAFYPAQVQMSNLLSHIVRTMERTATGQPVAGGFGGPATRLVVAVGHDSNEASLGGLLGLHWWLPGTAADPMLPGSALVFELRRHGSGPWRVRIFHVSQSLEQTRNLDPLSLEHPPEVAPIFVPGASVASPGYDLPWDEFRALAGRVIDPRFVLPDGS